MRPISAKVKKILQRADLWGFPCLVCGKVGSTQAEHALYHTESGWQGMGAKQVDDECAIIPLCRVCNNSNKSKPERYVMCCYLYEKFGKEMSERMVDTYNRRKDSLSSIQWERLYLWEGRLQSGKNNS